MNMRLVSLLESDTKDFIVAVDGWDYKEDGSEYEDQVRNNLEDLSEKHGLFAQSEGSYGTDGTFVVCANEHFSYEDAEYLIAALDYADEEVDDCVAIFRGKTKDEVVNIIKGGGDEELGQSPGPSAKAEEIINFFFSKAPKWHPGNIFDAIEKSAANLEGPDKEAYDAISGYWNESYKNYVGENQSKIMTRLNHLFVMWTQYPTEVVRMLE